MSNLKQRFAENIFTSIFKVLTSTALKKDLAKAAKLVKNDPHAAELVKGISWYQDELEDLLSRYCRRNPTSSRCTKEFKAHLMKLSKKR